MKRHSLPIKAAVVGLTLLLLLIGGGFRIQLTSPASVSQGKLAITVEASEYEETGWTLNVTIDGTSAEFTLDEIKELSTNEVEFHNHLYRGPAVRTLLARADVDIGKLKSVRAIASDGYRIEYDRRLAKHFDFILAHEMDGEPLPPDMGNLRIVFPGGRSRMVVKMVERLVVKLGEWRFTLATNGEEEFTLSEIEELPSREVAADSNVYKGVSLPVFLTEAGIDLGTVQTASVMASNGYQVGYDQAMLADTESAPLLAYEVNGEPLPEEVGTVVCLHKGELQVEFVERVIVIFEQSDQ